MSKTTPEDYRELSRQKALANCERRMFKNAMEYSMNNPPTPSIADIARACEVAYNTAWRWMHGLNSPNPRSRRILKEQFNLTLPSGRP